MPYNLCAAPEARYRGRKFGKTYVYCLHYRPTVEYAATNACGEVFKGSGRMLHFLFHQLIQGGVTERIAEGIVIGSTDIG